MFIEVTVVGGDCSLVGCEPVWGGSVGCRPRQMIFKMESIYLVGKYERSESDPWWSYIYFGDGSWVALSDSFEDVRNKLMSAGGLR